MKLRKGSVIVISLLAIVLLIVGFFALMGVTTIQKKTNLAGSHSAKLLRHNGIDINFRVQVDGQDIYFSPDFAPVQDDFREQIAWDKSGNILILEVAGKRLFGYDAEQKRQLTDDKLLSAEYTPFSAYHFEGKSPK